MTQSPKAGVAGALEPLNFLCEARSPVVSLLGALTYFFTLKPGALLFNFLVPLSPVYHGMEPWSPAFYGTEPWSLKPLWEPNDFEEDHDLTVARMKPLSYCSLQYNRFFGERTFSTSSRNFWPLS